MRRARLLVLAAASPRSSTGRGANAERHRRPPRLLALAVYVDELLL